MSGEANVWSPRGLIEISGATKTVEQRIVAIAGQSLFIITDFVYVVGTGALEVYKDGLRLIRGTDWVEQSDTTFSLTSPAALGDVIQAVAKVGITGSVDVRDTDIFLATLQELRDYAGTEISIYVQGGVAISDGKEGFFGKQTGAAPGTYVDNGFTVIVPTAGDGSAGWVKQAGSVPNTYVFSTVANMAASTTSAGLVIVPLLGMELRTLGHTSVNDGGQARYVVTTDTADGISIIDLGGGLSATLQIEGAVDICQYGVLPSNAPAVNDTNMAALLAWATTSRAYVTAKITGTYQFSAPWVIDGAFTFEGGCVFFQKFQFTQTSGNGVEIGTTNACNALTMSRLRLDCDQRMANVMIFNKNSAASDSAVMHFSDLVLDSYNAGGTRVITGLATDSVTNTIFEKMTIENCALGWRSGTQTNNNLFVNLGFLNCDKAIDAFTNEGNHLDSCKIQNITSGSTYDYVISLRQASFIFTNPYFENLQDLDIAFLGSGVDTIPCSLRITGGIISADKAIRYRGDTLQHEIVVEGVRMASADLDAWDVATAYVKSNKVNGSDGSVYIARTATTGDDPTLDTAQTYWEKYFGGVSILADTSSGYYSLFRNSRSTYIRQDPKGYDGDPIQIFKRDNSFYNGRDFSNRDGEVYPHWIQYFHATSLGHGNSALDYTLIPGQVYTMIMCLQREDAASGVTITERDTNGGSTISAISASNIVPVRQNSSPFEVRYIPFKAKGESLELLLSANKIYYFKYWALFKGCVFPWIDVDAISSFKNYTAPASTADWPLSTRVDHKDVATGQTLGWVLDNTPAWVALPNL